MPLTFIQYHECHNQGFLRKTLGTPHGPVAARKTSDNIDWSFDNIDSEKLPKMLIAVQIFLLIIFSDSRNPIFNSRNPNRVPKIPYKTLVIILFFLLVNRCFRVARKLSHMETHLKLIFAPNTASEMTLLLNPRITWKQTYCRHILVNNVAASSAEMLIPILRFISSEWTISFLDKTNKVPKKMFLKQYRASNKNYKWEINWMI